MKKDKSPWWGNLIVAAFVLFMIITAYYDYDDFIAIDHSPNQPKGSRGMQAIFILLDYWGGKYLLFTFLILLMILALWEAYKDYKNRFDD